MLKAIHVRQYKSFLQPHEVPLRPLTVLLGKNNSGKTSLARLPLLLAGLASAESDDGRPYVPLAIRGLNYGGNVEDLVTGRLPHDSFEIGASYQPAVAGVNEFRVTLQPVETLLDTFLVVSRLALTPKVTDALEWRGRMNDGNIPDYGVPGIGGFDGILPIYSDKRGTTIEHIRLGFRKHMSQIYHLSSLRQPISAVYEPHIPSWNLTASGSEAPFLLRSDRNILASVSQWYKSNLGIQIDIDDFGFGFRVTTGPDDRMNLAYAGQGVQQVFPVVCLFKAVAMEQLRADLLVVEEPELHLHPSAHTSVADLAIEALQHCQVIIETHSENFCLRIRRRVAEGALDPERVLFIWCGTDTPEELMPIDTASDGSVSNWPKGVFSEDLDEVRAISKHRQP